MKRYLKHDRHELDSREVESVWYAVRRELKSTGEPARGPRGGWRPALATATVAMVAVLAVGWWIGGRGPETMAGGQAGRQAAARPDSPRQQATRQAAPLLEEKRSEAPIVAMATKDPGARANEAAASRPAAKAEASARPVPDEVATDSDQASSVVTVAPELVVEAPQYEVAIKSAVTEHQVTGETFEKYAIDSVEDALSKQSGVVYRAGEKYVRGGRSGEVSMQIDGVARDNPLGDRTKGATLGAAPPPPAEAHTRGGLPEAFAGRPESAARVSPPAPGSITGGTTPPNGERYESMYFEHAGTNPFVATDEDALSTFALDVDNASFSLARSYLDRGELPPAAAIRVEEFVNAIDAGWPPHGRETFRIGLDGGPSRFGEGYHLLRVGIVARSVDKGERKPANLVFVIDISGSMDRENRLGAVKRALRMLVDELGEGDRVGIVTYGSDAQVRLRLVDASRRDEILEVIGGLHPTGSTNAAAGLRLGYELARRGLEPGHVNRVILCSDGVANTGPATDADGILALARGGADDGIALSTIGFGMGNYNDVLMERLADDGDGNYFYVDGPREAERVFRENLTGLLQTVAREAKVQVEFDPRRVARWRLLGYENRDVADRDFRNDAVDAGEVGVGHQVTALYELKLVAAGRETGSTGDESKALHRDGPIGVVRLRWEAPEHDTARAGSVTEVERPIEAGLLVGHDQAGRPELRAQALAAEFAEILRGSYWAKESRLSSLVPVADGLARELPGDQAVQDLARMIRRAADLRAETRMSDDDR